MRAARGAGFACAGALARARGAREAGTCTAAGGRRCAGRARGAGGAAMLAGRRGRGEAEALRVAGLRGVERDVAERAVAAVVRGAEGRGGVSEFVSPAAGAELLAACRRALPAAGLALDGGFEGAERCVLAGAPRADDAAQAAARAEMAAVEVAGRFGRAVSQRDLLGAVLAHIAREKVGDVRIGEESGFAVVRREVADYVAAAIDSVGKVKVQARVVEVSEVKVPERRVKEFTVVEKSTRLDAVGSTGFGISRSKMADGVRGGGVMVNHREVSSPAKTLKEGDVVSLRGKGRIEIGECGETRKGNIRVTILRYL